SAGYAGKEILLLVIYVSGRRLKVKAWCRVIATAQICLRSLSGSEKLRASLSCLSSSS
ncbi:22731_t:CDS:1, partial [Gigaspora rosea]